MIVIQQLNAVFPAQASECPDRTKCTRKAGLRGAALSYLISISIICLIIIAFFIRNVRNREDQ